MYVMSRKLSVNFRKLSEKPENYRLHFSSRALHECTSVMKFEKIFRKHPENVPQILVSPCGRSIRLMSMAYAPENKATVDRLI